MIDLEATCSGDGQVSRQEMEIIEIGAVMLEMANLSDFKEAPEFQTFIKPLRHVKLTDFCISLTSIQQSDVDQAPLYQDAIVSMKNWMSTFAAIEEILFCSWGAYDKKQFHQDCIWNGVAYPFTEAHCNIKQLFSTAPGQSKPKGLGKAIKSLGWGFTGIQHRGIDDAKNIARIVQWLHTQEIKIQAD